MMRDTRWRYFSYLNVDYKAAQDTLNTWAREGWELVEIMGPFAKLRRIERPDTPTYFLDWSNAKDPKDYAQLLSDAGWEWVERASYLNIYVSKPDAHPLPIQTDPELEYQRFRKKALRSMLLTTLAMAVLLAFCWFILSGFYSSPGAFQLAQERLLPSLLSSSLVFSAVFLFFPLWLFGGAAYFLYLFWRLRQWREAIRMGMEPPTAGSKAIRGWGLVRALGLLSEAVIALLLFPDALLNHFLNLGWAVGIMIGAFICIYTYDDPIRQRRGKRALFIAPLAAACILLNGPVRESFSGRIPAVPVHSDAHRVNEGRRSDTPLGSQAHWSEDIKLSDSERLYFYFSAQAWASPTLADWAFGPVPEGLEPVPGLEGIWRRGPAALEDVPEFTGGSAADIYEHVMELERTQETTRGFLLRRGTAQVTAECYGILPGTTDEEVLAPILEWLAQIE